MKNVTLLLVLFCMGISFYSCNPEELETENTPKESPAYATGGDEIDDHTEPDEDN